MRIALIHTRLLRRGGLETRLFSYIEWLSAQGHEVTVIVGKVAKDVILPPNVRLVLINLKLIPKPLRDLAFDWQLAGVVAEGKFDFALSLARTSHQDAVLAPGNHLGFLKATGRRVRGLSDRVSIALDRRAFAASTTILAASQMMSEEVIHYYGVDPAKVRVLHPPVDERRFHQGLLAQRGMFRSKYGFHPEKRSFVFVSSSHSRKGLPLLLAIFRLLVHEPFEVLIAGIGKVDDLPANVKDLGFVEPVEELYAAADFTILPALYEPYGQVVAESILCGVPVLVSHMVGAKEIVSSGEGRIIPSFSAADWVEAIRGISAQAFRIDPEFGVKHRIRLQDHMNAILGLVEEKQHSGLVGSRAKSLSLPG
jgi:glycosyltransferase involved in cell wall biosynthesis